jgi:hypothetical protein
MVDIQDLTLRQLREIQSMILQSESDSTAPCVASGSPFPFKIGDAVLIRTVTMIDLGRVKTVGHDFIVLEDGGWVADTARFGKCLATGELSEFERAPSWFVVGRGAIVDAFPWSHGIPQETV